jgi:protease II
MNVYFKKGIKLDRKNRTLIEGYGAYGLKFKLRI